MSKSILTAADAKKIIEKVWNSAANDYPVDVAYDGETIQHHDSAAKYLGITFYCYKRKVQSPYALVEAVSPDDSFMNPDADFSIKNIKVTFVVSAKKGDTLEHFVQNLRTRYLGVLEDFSITGKDIKGYLAFDTLTYEKQPETSATGLTITCSLALKISYTTNVALSDSEVYLLDGIQLPYTSGGAEVNRIGMPTDIHGYKSTQTLITSQTKSYRFRLPYVTDNAACVGLKRDILSGELDKEYTLTHYDGVTYTSDNPFTVQVTLNQTSTDRVTVAAPSEFEVVFVEADDQSKSQMRYEIGLIDWEFDMGSVNTRAFENGLDQMQYFIDKVVNEGAPFSRIKAPNINSLFLSSQVYLNKPENYPQGVSPLTLNALLNKNYAVVIEYDKANKYPSLPSALYYYFIVNARAGAGNRILLDLRLDTVQTYAPWHDKITYSDCIINKAHLNRFIDNGDGTVSFNSKPDSPLFKRENYQGLAQRCISREPIYLCVDKNSEGGELSPLDKWLKDNVKYWVYVYCKKQDANIVEVGNLTYASQGSSHIEQYIKGTQTGLVCFCYPVYKNDNKIFLSVANPDPYVDASNYPDKEWDGDTFWRALYLYEGDPNFSYYPTNSHILAVKCSARPPFERADYSGKYNAGIDLYLSIPRSAFYGAIAGQTGGTEVSIYGGYIFRDKNVLDPEFPYPYADYPIYVQKHSSSDFYFTEYIPSINSTFLKAGIVGSSRRIERNPKMFSSDFRSLSLENMDGQRFDYDIQKLGESRIRFKYTEVLTPDIVRGYLRIDRSKLSSGVYSDYADEDFTGLVYSTDNSIPFSSSQYTEWLAQNKNFYQIAQMQKDFASTQATINGVQGVVSNTMQGAAMGGPWGAVAGVVKGYAEAGMMQQAVDIDYRSRMLSVDNLRAAPNLVKNASGNAFFVEHISGQQLYYCTFAALDTELQQADSDMYMNGYNYGILDNIKNLLYTRKFFNAISAEIDAIKGFTMSNEIRNDIRQRFSRGLRFWHSDEIQYDDENYERWLED